MGRQTVEKYQRLQKETQEAYRLLLGEYRERVGSTGAIPDDSLSRQLDLLERAMLEFPPLHEEKDQNGKPTGLWLPRAKGLLGPEYNLRTPPPRRPFSKAQGGEFEVIPTSRWAEYIGGEDSVDMRDFVLDGMVLDQDGVGSCASEGMTGCIMASRVKAGQEPVKLNPWFAYYEVSGGSDQGSTLSDNVAFALEKGVPSQTVWGRDEGWRSKPSAEAFEDAKKHRLLEYWNIDDWTEFGTACILGLTVYFGYSGHAIWASKVLDARRLEYCNSWSTDWGDNGFGTLEKSRVQWGYGTYAFRSVTEASASKEAA